MFLNGRRHVFANNFEGPFISLNDLVRAALALLINLHLFL